MLSAFDREVRSRAGVLSVWIVLSLLVTAMVMLTASGIAHVAGYSPIWLRALGFCSGVFLAVAWILVRAVTAD